jgi:hypothetical protein
MNIARLSDGPGGRWAGAFAILFFLVLTVAGCATRPPDRLAGNLRRHGMRDYRKPPSKSLCPAVLPLLLHPGAFINRLFGLYA